MEELTLEELLEIKIALRMQISNVEQSVLLLGSDDMRGKTLNCLKSAYEKIYMIEREKIRNGELT